MLSAAYEELFNERWQQVSNKNVRQKICWNTWTRSAARAHSLLKCTWLIQNELYLFLHLSFNAKRMMNTSSHERTWSDELRDVLPFWDERSRGRHWEILKVWACYTKVTKERTNAKSALLMLATLLHVSLGNFVSSGANHLQRFSDTVIQDRLLMRHRFGVERVDPVISNLMAPLSFCRLSFVTPIRILYLAADVLTGIFWFLQFPFLPWWRMIVNVEPWIGWTKCIFLLLISTTSIPTSKEALAFNSLGLPIPIASLVQLICLFLDFIRVVGIDAPLKKNCEHRFIVDLSTVKYTW